MSDTAQRSDVHAAFRVKRHLILQQPAETIASTIVEQIRLQPGVAAVMFDPESRRLDIEYDASQLQIGEVREIVRDQGGEFERGWWANLRAHWYRFTDQNIRDNARHEPHCCNKAPPGKLRKP